MSDIEWRSKAACKDADSELFFPLNIRDAEDAQDICFEKCPVRATCAAEAVRTRNTHGVHGGFFLPDQKALLRRYVKNEQAAETGDPALVTSICIECGTEIRAKFPKQRCRPCVLGEARQEPRVLVGVVRPHLMALRAEGWSNRAISTESGVHHQTVGDVVAERALSVTRSAANELFALQLKSVNA